MKRKKMFIGLGVIVALLAIFFILSMPEEQDSTASEKNTLLYQALLANGIRGAVVDVTAERVLVRYNLPDLMNKTEVTLYILGATASVAPEVEKIIVQTYQNFEPVDEVVISTKDVISFTEGEISEEEFLRKIL